ncbi:MAG: glycine--tRNA ligase, partial [Metallosphaera sp.]
KLPLGIAQVGEVARNEISPRQGLVRMREFTIMEVEFFIDPEDKDVPWLEKFYDDEINVLFSNSKEKGERPSRIKIKEMVDEKLVVNPWMAFWMASASKFVQSIGIAKENFYFEEKLPYERAHYSSQTFDQIVEVLGEKVEISGHAYRGNYDLSRHSKFSNEDLTVFKKFDNPRVVKRKTILINKDKLKNNPELQKEVMSLISGKNADQIELLVNSGAEIKDRKLSEFIQIIEREEKEHGIKFYPHVVEPSFGVERCLYLSLLSAYKEKKDRVVLSLPKNIVPYQVAVFPLLDREELTAKAKEIYNMLKDNFEVLYDDSGSIGKRYARVDEIGVPYAITVDPQSLSDDTVTVRDRDTWEQVRIKTQDLNTFIQKLFSDKGFSMVSGEAKR